LHGWDWCTLDYLHCRRRIDLRWDVGDSVNGLAIVAVAVELNDWLTINLQMDRAAAALGFDCLQGDLLAWVICVTPNV
jgi:hypothetical protein